MRQLTQNDWRGMVMPTPRSNRLTLLFSASIRIAQSTLRGLSPERLWRVKSYAQHKEDLILAELLSDTRQGFYVDIGAFDPFKFSNTAFFSRRGWTGINIEPMPDRFQRFTKARPRDVNLNIGIARETGQATLFRLEPETLTTFVEKDALQFASLPGHRLVDRHQVALMPLRSVLDHHASGRRIDFLSIDVEGMEREVLASNDWDRHRPRVVLIESVRYSPNAESERPSTNDDWQDIFDQNEYVKAGDTPVNSFYIDRRDSAIVQQARIIWPE